MKLSDAQIEALAELLVGFQDKGVTRRVRTPAGRRKFGQQIGEVIVPDVVKALSRAKVIWKGDTGCRAIRQSAYEILGYDLNEQTALDPVQDETYIRDYRRKNQTDELAVAMIGELSRSSKIDAPLYRTVAPTIEGAGFEDIIKSLKDTDTFDIPLVAFSKSRKVAESFVGGGIMFVLEPGAKGIPVRYESEVVTGGRFKVVSVKGTSGRWTKVTLKQVGVYDSAGRYREVKVASKKIWRYDYIFDGRAFSNTDDLDTKGAQRHVRDVAFWGAPYGTPLPLPTGFVKPKEVFKKRPKKIAPDKAKKARLKRLDHKDADPEVAEVARDITEMEWGGFTTSVNLKKSSLERGVFWISGDIFKDGEKVGYYQRILDYDSKEMENGGLVLKPEYQGQGFAERFYDHVESAAWEQGMRKIRINANIDVGGYAWARRGFKFRDAEQRDLFKDAVKVIADADPGDIITLYGIDYTATPSLIAAAQKLMRNWRSVTPLDIAQLGERARSIRATKTTKSGRVVPMWPGKSLMLGSSWFGVKPIANPGKTKDAIFDYVAEIEQLIPYAESMFVPGDVFEPHEGNESDYNILGADLFYDPPLNNIPDQEHKDFRGTYEEKGVRRVRDVEYWGMPYGTIITPGMKPVRLPSITESDIPSMGSTNYSESKPPPYLYRAVSEEDWSGIQDRGFMQSDERMNVAANEGTVAADRDPSFYLPWGIGAQGRILRIKYDPADMWWRDSDGYWKTNSKIPLARIDATTDRYIDQDKPENYTPERLLRNFRNKITRAIQDVPGYEGYGIPAALREREWEIGNALDRGEVTKESLTKYLDELETYLAALRADVEENAFNADQKTYDDLVANVSPLINQARETLKRPGLFDNPEPEYSSAIQMRLPGMPKPNPVVPAATDEIRASRREKATVGYAREEAEAIRRLVRLTRIDDDSPEGREASRTLYNEYGISFDDLSWENPFASGGDWQLFGGCRDIRTAAYDILGYDVIDEEENIADPHLTSGGDPGWGQAQSSARAPYGYAYALLSDLNEADRVDIPLWRGVELYSYSNAKRFVEELQQDKTFDLPLASFAGRRKDAERFGDSVIFRVQPNAKAVQGGFMGYDEDDERYYADDSFIMSEMVTGGRFAVVSVKEDSRGRFIVTIRQVATFNPDTGLATKKPNRRWKYANLFDNSLTALSINAVVVDALNSDTRSNKPSEAERGQNAR